jgi:hypothetical protein
MTKIPMPPIQQDAFISYSSRDQLFAAALAKALENYFPPKEWRDEKTGNLEVIRDKDDFLALPFHQQLEIFDQCGR